MAKFELSQKDIKKIEDKLVNLYLDVEANGGKSKPFKWEFVSENRKYKIHLDFESKRDYFEFYIKDAKTAKEVLYNSTGDSGLEEVQDLIDYVINDELEEADFETINSDVINEKIENARQFNANFKNEFDEIWKGNHCDFNDLFNLMNKYFEIDDSYGMISSIGGVVTNISMPANVYGCLNDVDNVSKWIKFTWQEDETGYRSQEILLGKSDGLLLRDGSDYEVETCLDDDKVMFMQDHNKWLAKTINDFDNNDLSEWDSLEDFLDNEYSYKADPFIRPENIQAAMHDSDVQDAWNKALEAQDLINSQSDSQGGQ